VAAAAALAALAGLGWLRGPRSADRPFRAGAPAAAQEEFSRAFLLNRDGHFVESLPHLQAAMAAGGDESAQAHFAYGLALYSAGFQVRRTPWPVPALRSSFERATFARTAIAEFDRAGRLTTDPSLRTEIAHRYATVTQAWGLDWETLSALRAMESGAPGSTDAARRASAFAELMRAPNRYALDAVPVAP
jgi:hypothetical protein